MMPYLYRLLCVCLASFFLVHLFGGFLLKVLEERAIRLANRLSASSAARFLFALRLFPSAFSTVAVAGFCLPSYLLLEPRGIDELVGAACSVAAVMGFAICARPVYRGSRAVLISLRGRAELEPPSPVLALVGVCRPKLLISREALAVLSTEELQSAIRHEQAHQLARDNLKRLLILFAPDLLPFWSAFSAIERAWARSAEWAADDHAAGEDAERSLSLASALVRVARLSSPLKPVLLMTSFLADTGDLSARIERLLCNERRPARRMHIAMAPVVLVVVGLLLAFAVQATTLNSVHELLERLIH